MAWIGFQLSITPSGSPLWDTSAPSSPIFTLTYNSTSVLSPSSSNSNASSTPPPSANSNASGGISAGNLAAAIVVPLLVLALLGVAGWVGWKKWKKRPEEKRWSKVRLFLFHSYFFSRARLTNPPSHRASQLRRWIIVSPSFRPARGRALYLPPSQTHVDIPTLPLLFQIPVPSRVPIGDHSSRTGDRGASTLLLELQGEEGEEVH